MPLPSDLLECKLRDSIKIGTGPNDRSVNKTLHDNFHNHPNYDMLENSVKFGDDLAFLLSVDVDNVQSATSTVFRTYLAKTISFRNSSDSCQNMDEQAMGQYIGADQLANTTAIFDDHAARDGNTFKLGKDLESDVGTLSSRGTCGAFKACLFTKGIELFINKCEAAELKKIADGPNSTNTIAAKSAVQEKYRNFYKAVNSGVSDAVVAYANEGGSTTKCTGLVKTCGVAVDTVITPHEWVGHAVKYEACGKWVDETGCYSWRMQDPKRDSCDHFMDAERILKRFRQTDIPDTFKDNNALVEAAYAYKDNESAAQAERMAIKRNVEEICQRNQRPRRE